MHNGKEIHLPFDQDRAIRRGSVMVDLEILVAMRGSQAVKLTSREVDILGFARGVFTHDDIIQGIKNAFGEKISKNVVSSFKHGLRIKLGQDVFQAVRQGEYVVNESSE